MVVHIKGLIILIKEIPAVFRLDNSYLSDKLPKSITEANKTPIGKASGTNDNDR